MLFIPVLAVLATLAMALATPDTPARMATRQSHAGIAAAARSVFDFLDPNIDSYLLAHNKVRALHGAQDLVWNDTLASAALDWANTCQVKHSDGGLLATPYGENVVAATGDFPISDAIKQFTLDESEYDPSNPTYNHWTQVVWKATTQLGCALSRCSGVFDENLGQASYYVCLYGPVGNVIGQATANVQVGLL